jgi:hypothetical protein
MKRIAFLLALLAHAAYAAAAPEAKAPCAFKDRECANRILSKSPVRTLDRWAPALALPLAERIGPAPQDLVDYLALDNIGSGFPQKPKAAKLSPEFLADARGALEDLLPVLKRLVGGTFAGVYFIDDLGGTGFSDLFTDGPDGPPAGAYIVLDAKVLGGFRANAWATWKENTPFKPDRAWKLEAKIEEPAHDNRRSAIRYILLHEMGHVVAATRPLHPRWDRPVSELRPGATLPFFDLSWTVDRKANKYVSKFDAAFPKRSQVVYYLGAKLEAKDITPVYRSLDRTNFPTLYAATSPGDDFAESFASYVHTVVLKRPWSIRIYKDGQPDLTYRTCWDDPRCVEKRDILETLLK